MPLVFSAISSLITLNFSDGTETTENLETGNTTTSESAGTQAAEQFREDTRDTVAGLRDEFTGRARLTTVPAGTRIEIVLSQDLYFRSPREVVTIDGTTYDLVPQDGQAVLEAPPAAGWRSVERPDGRALEGGRIVRLPDGRQVEVLPTGRAAPRRSPSAQFNQQALPASEPQARQAVDVGIGEPVSARRPGSGNETLAPASRGSQPAGPQGTGAPISAQSGTTPQNAPAAAPGSPVGLQDQPLWYQGPDGQFYPVNPQPPTAPQG